MYEAVSSLDSFTFRQPCIVASTLDPDQNPCSAVGCIQVRASQGQGNAVRELHVCYAGSKVHAGPVAPSCFPSICVGLQIPSFRSQTSEFYDWLYVLAGADGIVQSIWRHLVGKGRSKFMKATLA